MKNLNMPRAATCSGAEQAVAMAREQRNTAANGHAMIFLAFLAAAMLLGGCAPEALPDADANAFTLSDTMFARIGLDTVRMLPVENSVELNARIAPDEGRLARVYPIVGGQVADVRVELGDHVAKGQTLAVIRSSEVAKLERKLIEAQSDMEVADKNLATKQELFNSQLLSERKLVEARYDVEKARARLKDMQEVFSIYQFQAGSQYIVTAPISGYVIEKDVVRDETLPSDHHEAIFTIAELGSIWVLADVYESDIARVKEGMPAEVSTLSYPGKVFSGQVDKIMNMLDPRTRTMRIRITLPNPEVLLKPEMIAHVRLTYQDNDPLPAIPASAVISDNNREQVMVFKDRKNIDTRRISIAHSLGGTSWVAGGLKPGEVVISKEQLFIYDALNDR